MTRPDCRSPPLRLLLRTPLLSLALLASAGCFRASVILPGHLPAETHSRWVHGFFWGAVGGTIDAGQTCGGRPVARVTTERSPGNIAVQWLTLGIYTPSRLSITCSSPAAPAYGYYQPPGWDPQ